MPRRIATLRTALPSGAAPTTDATPIQTATRPVFRSGTEGVLVNVSVRDEEGRFVSGLQQDQFRVYDNGVRQPVTFFASEEWPCHVVLAIDVSASMSDSIRDVKRAAKAFLGALRPDDYVTVVAFNSAFFLLAPPTASPKARLRSIRDLGSAGGTALFDALLDSVDLLAFRDRRRAIVAFTDGKDHASKATLDGVEHRLATENVVLYVVGYGSTSHLPISSGNLDRVARTTGGRAVFLDDVRNASDAFRGVLRDLSDQYTLGFTPSSDAERGARRELRVEVDGGAYLVRARQGYLSQTPGGQSSRPESHTESGGNVQRIASATWPRARK